MAKNPTNADIIKEIHEMNNTLNSHNARIGSLEMWQNGTTVAAISSTSPFTWGTNDYLKGTFTYEAT